MGGSIAVLGSNAELVMKVGYNIDIDHIPTLDYIKGQASRISIPDIHGILQHSNSKQTYLFMLRIPITPLDSIWKSLSDSQKPPSESK